MGRDMLIKLSGKYEENGRSGRIDIVAKIGSE